MSKQNEVFKQVLLQYDDGAKEPCWISSDVAFSGKRVYDKESKIQATVVEVWHDIELSKEELNINRQYPMRDATDI